MFIAKNNDLIILAKETREELEQALQLMVYTSIEETNENYVLINGAYLLESEALEIIKSDKQKENTALAHNAVENGYVVFKGAEFETNAQTVGDLTATMLMLQAQQDPNAIYMWLSKDDKVVELTLEDFGTLGGLIAEYKNTIWQEKYINYKAQIEQAQTVDVVNNINLDYSL